MLKSKLTTAILAGLVLGYAGLGHAQTADTQGDSSETKSAKKLDAVTVTGSLIPQTEIETATPVITITADQIQARGFATVAQAL